MEKIKYFVFIIFVSFIGFTSVFAAKPLMQCDYNAKTFMDGNDFNKFTYFKYRFTYYDDETLIQESIRDYKDNGYEKASGKNHMNLVLFNQNDEYVSTYGYLTQSNFTANNVKNYYEQKTCPYLWLQQSDTSSNIAPVEDSNLNDPSKLSYVTKGTITLFDDEGQTNTPDPPKIVKTCPLHVDSISYVKPITIIFSLYDNGKKTVKVYFTDSGEASGQEATVTSVKDDKVFNITPDRGVMYQIILPAEEISNIFVNSDLTCTTKLYLIEDSIGERRYHFSSDEDEVNDYTNTGEAEEGTGEEGEDQSPDDMEQDIKPIVFCEDPGVLKVIQIIGYVLFVIKILVPLLLIILGSVDFAKATISSDDKSNKEAISSLTRRIILGVVIFIIPTILNYVLTLVDNAVETSSKFSNCTTCLLEPTKCKQMANN